MKRNFEARGDECPACGGGDLRRFLAKLESAAPVNIVECTRCDFAWQWPLSRGPEVGSSYFEAMYQNPAENSYFDRESRRKVATLQMDYLRCLAVDARTLLDVGCGAGVFVTTARSYGWNAVGIDPAAPTSEYTSRRSLQDLTATELFDVITMWDVLEHVERPKDLIEAAARHLRERGMLVIETGNYQSGGRIEAGRRWWAYQPDHRWYFSPPVLYDLLRQCGLADVGLVRRVFRPGWTGPGHNLGPSRRMALERVLKAPWRVIDELKTFLALKDACRKWPEWVAFEIMTITARRATH